MTRFAVFAGALLLVASVAAAQFGGRSVRPALILPDGGFDGAFTFCRISFRNSPYGDGSGWHVDYPRADLNLSTRLAELTTTLVSRNRKGEPNHVVVRLTDPELFR